MREHILTENMGVRFAPGTYELIKKVAILQGVGPCDFVRVSVKRELARLSFLPDEEKKAVEVV